MASVITSKFVPTPEQIAASCAELDAKRLADFDAGIERSRGADRGKRKARAAANRVLQQSNVAEPVDLETGPREMTKADICNVEFINSRDLDDVLDGIIEAVGFQHRLEDCECRWNIADVDHDLMDLSDPAPFKGRDVVPFRSKRK